MAKNKVVGCYTVFKIFKKEPPSYNLVVDDNNNQEDYTLKQQPTESTKIIEKLLSIGGAQNVAVLLNLSTRDLKLVADTPLDEVTRGMRVSIDFARVLIATADNEIERRAQMLSTSHLVSLYQRAKKGMGDIDEARKKSELGAKNT